MFTAIVSAIASVYLMFISIMMDVKNIQSAIIFKLSPFVLAILLGVPAAFYLYNQVSHL